MGGSIEATDGHAPLIIRGGRLRPITWESKVASAQVKSAIMLAGLVPPGVTTVVEPLATRDHSERAFPAFGLSVRTSAPPDGSLTPPSGPVTVSVEGGQEAQRTRTNARCAGRPVVGGRLGRSRGRRCPGRRWS